MDITSRDALIAVDIQNDFCHGGALPVPGGGSVARVATSVMPRFEHIVLSRDWHPQDHCSFSDEPDYVDGSWPTHCVANSPGAEFHGDLHVPADAIIIDKGADSSADAYSAFDHSGLADQLKARGVDRVFVCGLAAEYCVKATVLDALRAGFQVVVLENGVRGLDDPEGSEQAALDEMQQAGALMMRSGELE